MAFIENLPYILFTGYLLGLLAAVACRIYFGWNQLSSTQQQMFKVYVLFGFYFSAEIVKLHTEGEIRFWATLFSLIALLCTVAAAISYTNVKR